MKVCFFKDDIWEFNPIYQQQYYDMPVKHLPSTAIWWPPTAPGSLWVNTEQQRQDGDGTLAVCRSAAEHQGEVVLPCSSLRIMD